MKLEAAFDWLLPLSSFKRNGKYGIYYSKHRPILGEHMQGKKCQKEELLRAILFEIWFSSFLY